MQDQPGYDVRDGYHRMPVTYKIDTAGETIRTECTGDVTLEEVLGHFRALAKDPDCPPRLDVLLDLSQTTSVPRSEDLRDVVTEIERVRGNVRFGACAIVACTDALFGMLRMFEVYAEQHFRNTSVFRTLPEAEEWLAAQVLKSPSVP